MSKTHLDPHGGRLINRILEGKEREDILDKLPNMKKKRITEREYSDLEMIATGCLSPLEGFMCKADYENVLDVMRLANGVPWTIPITLSTSPKEADEYNIGENIALELENGLIVGVLYLEDKFRYDKEKEAVQVYGTKESEHPGVYNLYKTGDVLLGGRIGLVKRVKYDAFNEYRFDPADTREIFKKKGWKRIVGFQTRNPIHRAHEYIQKCALEVVDGLFIHPLVGETKGDDLSAEIRMESYKVILDGYYPKDRTFIGVFPAAMRYAGPKEAIFHAILRKNYGCTHFIVGRDHAGVKNYYGSFDAHYIFDEFDPHELGITPMFFDYTFFCKSCGGMASYKTCPHSSENHISLSGTKVRALLRDGKTPPAEFTRPEVAKVLIKGLARPDFCI